jgi:hypothetical protein
VRFEIDARRIYEEDGGVELASNDEGVVAKLGEEGFATPTRCEGGALLTLRVSAANGEGRGTAVLVEKSRLGLIVVEVKRREGDAAEEMDGHGANPGGEGGRLNL